MEACERGRAALHLRPRGMKRACERNENGNKQLQELQSQVHLTTTEVMQKQQRLHDEALEAQVIPRIH